MAKGIVKQIIGPTIDIEFPADELPKILNAIHIKDEEKGIDLIAEVSMQLGDSLVRCLALSSTTGLVRGVEAVDLKAPIKVPVGPNTLGRLFNVLGDPIDELEKVKDAPMSSIH